MEFKEIIAGLKAAVVHLAVTGYLDDKEQRVRILKMAKAISFAISLLEDGEFHV